MSLLETVQGWLTPAPITEVQSGPTVADMAKFVIENFGGEQLEDGTPLAEAFTQADIELALDDRGWLVGGKRMMGELDPLSRQVQVNRSRYYWLRDPLAKQSVRLWTDYALGDTAMSWHCEDKGVQAKLDTFMKNRVNRRYCSRKGQRRLSQRLLVDGELFFGIFEDGEIKTFDCLQITDIITDPDDEDTVVAYKRVRVKSKGQTETLYYKPWDLESDAPINSQNVGNDGYNLVPIDPMGGKQIKYEDGVVMYHLAFDDIERRGNGLLTCCSDWAREHRRFMIARVAIMQAIKKFAFTTTVKGGQNVVNSIRAKLESTFAQSGLSGGTQHQPVAAPGANFVGNEGVTIKAMPQATGSGDAVGDANQLKLMVSAGTGIMLHYFGDPGTTNLASATAMELPMLKQFASYQIMWKDFWRDIFAIILEEKNDDPNPADITIDMPDILEDDLGLMAQFITALTTVFPEAKVPALLKQCLQSANVDDLDDVMEDIEAQKEENDAQAELDAKTQHQNALQLVGAKQGLASQDPSDKGSLMPDSPGAVGESDPIMCLTKALMVLREALQ